MGIESAITKQVGAHTYTANAQCTCTQNRHTQAHTSLQDFLITQRTKTTAAQMHTHTYAHTNTQLTNTQAYTHAAITSEHNKSA